MSDNFTREYDDNNVVDEESPSSEESNSAPLNNEGPSTSNLPQMRVVLNSTQLNDERPSTSNIPQIRVVLNSPQLNDDGGSSTSNLPQMRVVLNSAQLNDEGSSTSNLPEMRVVLSMPDESSSSSMKRTTSAIAPREEFRSDLPTLRAMLNSPASLPPSEREASSNSEYSTTSTAVQDYEETLSSAEAAMQEGELSFANRIRQYQDGPGPSSGSRHNQPFANVSTKIPKKITQRRDQTEFETGGNGHSPDSMEDEGISSDSDSTNVIFEPFNAERGMRAVEPFSPSDTSSNGSRSPMKYRLNPSGPSNLRIPRPIGSRRAKGIGAFDPVPKNEDGSGKAEEDANSSTSEPPSPPPTSPPPISPPPISPSPISPPPYPEEANQEMLKISPNTMADRRRKLSPPEGASTAGKRTKKNGDEDDVQEEENKGDEESAECSEILVVVGVPSSSMSITEESSSGTSSGSRNKEEVETDDSVRPEVGSSHRGSELDSDIEDLPDEGKESDA